MVYGYNFKYLEKKIPPNKHMQKDFCTLTVPQ